MAKAVAKKEKRKSVAKKLLHLKNYNQTEGDVARLRSDIFDRLGNYLYSTRTWTSLLFHSLATIKEVSGKALTEDLPSLEKASVKVLTHFGFDPESDNDSFLDKSGTLVEFKEHRSIRTFINFILQLETLPYCSFEYLDANVRTHLREITKLILWYEKTPYLVSYLEKNQSPTNQEESTLFDFYTRCKNEQKIILNYLLFEMGTRALDRCYAIPLGLGPVFEISGRYRDFPYKFGHHDSDQFFDYREIDQVGHRVAQVPVKLGHELQQEYKRDKEKFYRKLFKTNPPIQIFQNFEFYQAHLPFSNDRTEIFQELKKLYRGRRWISFFALALPQVEGLFTEMVAVTSPDQKNKSLPVKVHLVRPLYQLSDYSFDYFQYIVPLLRNKFSHTGHDKDFKVKCYDLLTDLDFLFRVFYQLDNPLVILKQIHLRKDPFQFTTHQMFADYFSLIDSLPQSQLKERKTTIVDFEQNFLNTSCDVEVTCREAIESVPSEVKRIHDLMASYLESDVFAHKLKTREWSEIKAQLADQVLFEKVRLAMQYLEREVTEFDFLARFLYGYKKHLPSLSKEIATQLERSKHEIERLYTNLSSIKKILPNSTP
jgi:hypothetical protein